MKKFIIPAALTVSLISCGSATAHYIDNLKSEVEKYKESSRIGVEIIEGHNKLILKQDKEKKLLNQKVQELTVQKNELEKVIKLQKDQIDKLKK